MTGALINIVLAACCFGMFFAFGPSPENQLDAICGLACLFFAYVCYDTARRPR